MLEMSLKPFKKTDDDYIKSVVTNVFMQWKPLLKNRKEISIMLWAGDGSEILDYNGNTDSEFEWACFVGTANNPLISESEPAEKSLHSRKHYYTENPTKMTYRILKQIVSEIKSVGKELYPSCEISVGETFDIGPEFAVSDFKYIRHPEITSGQTLDRFGFLDATAVLSGDDGKYAAYPDGIPDGTPFATFFGKQCKIFFNDVGFDFIWLSNGVGFGDCPWKLEGKIFDGEKFYPEKLANVKKKNMDFWKLFRAEFPDAPIATRGTNFSVGIDYATDGVAQYEIYKGGYGILPPPNSPWGAIDGNFGRELAGHMTRICELPEKDFLFRYYIHDPWWVNSPWYDRYGGEPYDIYLPMSLSRVDENGNVQSAGIFSILSVDNSFGNFPDACVNEPLPHILKAEKDIADSPSPIVWVYPMREFSSATSEAELSEMYYGDNFVIEMINDCFPLNCVVSADNFSKHDLSLYKSRILLSPAFQSENVLQKLRDFEKSGGTVIYYGSSEFLSAINGKHKLDIGESVDKARKMLGLSGYSIVIDKKSNDFKSPVMSMVSKDNGYIISAYNPDLTNTVKLKFPLGAPILTGTDCEIIDGYSVYRFPRSLHKECRVFVKQEDGVVSLNEIAPVSTVYHRAVQIRGLKDATVIVFPEKRDEKGVRAASNITCDSDPVYDMRFHLVNDEAFGTYYKGEHISGDYIFLFPFGYKKP